MVKNKKKKLNKLEKWAKEHQHSNVLICSVVTIIFIFFGLLGPYNSNLSNKQYSVKEAFNKEEEKNGQFGIFIENSSRCNSDFLDIEKWTIDSWWQRDNQVFTYNPKEGWGPKMTFDQKVTNNFHMVVKFVPILNEKKEINFVIYIGKSYRIILGDGNNTHFYLKQRDNIISETNSDFVGPIELENRIRFNEPVEIEMIQSMMNDSNVINVSLNFRYSPDENKNSGQIRARKKPYIFQIDDSLYYNNEKEVSLGLLYSERSRTAIVTKFNCFDLESR